MRIRTSLAAALLAMLMAVLRLGAAEQQPASEQAAEESSCVQCHSNGDVWDKDQLRYFITAKDFTDDIHWQSGLRCPDCHGGDAKSFEVTAAHSKDAGFKSVKSPSDVPPFCGNCHANVEFMRHYQPSPRTDQLREYWTSGHGIALKTKGDTKVATCISCHGKPHGSAADRVEHGILAIDNLASPVYRTRVAKTCAHCHADANLMAGYEFHGHPLGHEQYAHWRESVHGRALMDNGDLSAPTCNNCHGNHGAVPPTVTSVANACGTCHGRIAELFNGTKMKHRFEEEKLPGCATCHTAHQIQHPTEKMVGMQAGTFCVRCHKNGRYGATLAGATAAREIRQGLDELKRRIALAQTTLARAGDLGMEVSQPEFELHKAVSSLTNARTLVHSFAVTPVAAALAQGEKVTTDVQGKAEKALREHRFRRVWLAASLVPILVVIGMLLLYIRTLPVPDGKKHGTAAP